MTPQEINIALAEFEGWIKIRQTTHDWEAGDPPLPPQGICGISPLAQQRCAEYVCFIPNYYSDLNAVHRLVCKLGKMDGLNTIMEMQVLRYGQRFEFDESAVLGVITMEPKYWCEALLKTIGKWKD